MAGAWNGTSEFADTGGFAAFLLLPFLALLLLLATHMLLFLTLICPKCSYSDTCPAG